MTADLPVRIEVFMDYHCPYSHRAVAWLDDLGREQVKITYRLFGLEQVNRDPTATHWRLWEQPLDYVHYRERQDRRPLAAFIATALVEAAEPPAVARRFRRAVYAARFDERADISDFAVLEQAAQAAGVTPNRVRDGLAIPAAGVGARDRIAADWAAARSPWLVFGVPTLRLDDETPIYLRLANMIPPADGPGFLAAFRAFRAAAPGVLEFKQPEAAAPG